MKIVLEIKYYKYLLFGLFILAMSSCESDELKSKFILLDSTMTGVNFTNTLTESDRFNIIQYLYFYNGAGVGTGDFNNDGFPDIFFGSNQESPQLYLNKGEGTISFMNVSEESGLADITGWSTGISVVDINTDGLLDVYLCQLGNYKSFYGKNRLLINKGLDENGIPSFEDKTIEYGLDYSGLSTQAAFFDFDVDGDLDMYLLNHSVHRTANYGNASFRNEFSDQFGDRLYVNENGQFKNKTSESGIYSSRIGYGLGIAISDIDNNGFSDIYIGNDFHENDYLYLNQGDGSFLERIQESTGHTSQFTMGVDIADINDDGFSDIFSLDMRPDDPHIRQTTVSHDPNTIFEFKHQLGYHYQYPKNHLQINQGNNQIEIPVFSEIASAANIDATDWSWSTLIEDFDNDGLKDIFISNGILRRPNDLDYLNYIANEKVQDEASDLELAQKMPTGESSNYFFFNQGNYAFEKDQMTTDIGVSTGASYADFDLDGDLDLVVNNINREAFIYKNQAMNNFIQLSFGDVDNSEIYIGAKVIAIAKGKKYFRELNPYRGFMSSVDPTTLTIGLGDQAKVDSLVVIWPDGFRQLIENLDVNQRLSLTKKQGAAFPKLRSSKKPLLQQSSIEGLKINHVEDKSRSDQLSSLQILSFDNLGPCITTADINNDQIVDVFVGGGRNTASKLFLSQSDDMYIEMTDTEMSNDSIYEDISASFMDVDMDADLDLLVGHVTDELKGIALRYYLNDGNNNFEKKVDPISVENPIVIAASDFDQDGDIDYFLGSRYSDVKGSGNSAIMVNDGTGKYSRFGTEIENLGQVNDAIWADIDGDDDEDLIIVSEWRAITLLINKENGFSKREVTNSEGLWKSIGLADIDQDGDLDFIAGNVGLNSTVDASISKPLINRQYNIENSTAVNPIVYFNDKDIMQSSDDIVKRIPSLKKELSNYKNFSTHLLSKEFISETTNMGKAVTLQTSIFYNDGQGNFDATALPIEAQFSSVHATYIGDLNHDNLADIILAGNEYNYTSSFGRQDASHGIILLQNKNNSFQVLSASQSGLYLNGQVRDIIALENEKFLFTLKNKPSLIYQLYR